MHDFVTREFYDKSGDNGIGWCGRTANILRGCSEVPGRRACEHCYAAECASIQDSNRRLPFYGMGLARRDEHGIAKWSGVIAPAGKDAWTRFFRSISPTLIFLNSMSDIFHEKIGDEYVLHILRTIHFAFWHVFQVLTKRHGRMAQIMARLYEQDGTLHLAERELDSHERALIPNLWLGTTVEDQRRAELAIPSLVKVQATVRFLSMEPLFEPVDIRRYLRDIHWVIVGGESGSEWRPMDIEWARNIRDQCAAANVPWFFKQESGSRPEVLPALDGIRHPWLPRRETFSAPLRATRNALIRWADEEYDRLIEPWAQKTRASANLVSLTAQGTSPTTNIQGEDET